MNAINSLTSGDYEWRIKPHENLILVHILKDNLPLSATLTFTLEQSSSLIYCPIILGCMKTELALHAVLHDFARCTIAGSYALTGTQECILTTRQEHQGVSSFSSLIINGIAADEAQLNYQGSICIQKKATQSNAQQENKTLLLGSHAKAISIPSLEVQTNEVQCAHGSAVGPLQEEQLLYAQSRGLSFSAARRLLITSFFAQTLHGMVDEALRENIIAQLVNKVLVDKE